MNRRRFLRGKDRTDMEGNRVTLHDLCAKEPVWASSRILDLERQVAALQDELQLMRDYLEHTSDGELLAGRDKFLDQMKP